MKSRIAIIIFLMLFSMGYTELRRPNIQSTEIHTNIAMKLIRQIRILKKNDEAIACYFDESCEHELNIIKAMLKNGRWDHD